MTAIGAIDIALWDIKAKALNTPLYNLLGGRSRDGVMVYGHANGRDIEEAGDAVARHIDEGFLAVRAQAGVSGLPTTYGVPKDGKPYEPAERGLPHSAGTAPAADCARAETHWKSAEEIKTVAVYEDHLARFPNCEFSALASARIQSLKR